MVNYAAKHQIQDVEDLKYFDTDGYYFAPVSAMKMIGYFAENGNRWQK